MPYLDEAELQAFLGELRARWEREPHLFKQPFSRPLVGARDYWGMLRKWGSEVRSGQRFASPRWIEADLLPRAEDGGVEGFCRRIEAGWKGDWYLYLADGVQRWSPEVWHRLAEIVRPLVEQVGSLPPGGMMLDFFLGRYDRTPTGIHRDDGEVLAFVTVGPKRLHFWPRERFEAPWASAERTHFQTGIWSYERHLGDAITLEAEPGDVIYWPRSHYHLGASSDHWSGMVTLTMWWQASAERAIRYLVDALVARDGEPASYPVAAGRLADAARALPAGLAGAAGRARRALDAGWDETLAEGWARLVTAYGFQQPPAPLPVPAIPPERWRVRHPLAVVEIGGRRAVFACGHRAFTLAADSPLASARLEALAPGDVVGAASPFGVGADAETEALLAALCAAGALEPA